MIHCYAVYDKKGLHFRADRVCPLIMMYQEIEKFTDLVTEEEKQGVDKAMRAFRELVSLMHKEMVKI